MPEVRDIHTQEDVDALLRESHLRPVALFKYSPVCPISSAAQDEWERFTVQAAEDVALARCDVISARPAARGICEHTGVRHESPQLLVLRDGRCHATTSHYAIDAGWIAGALSSLP